MTQRRLDRRQPHRFNHLKLWLVLLGAISLALVLIFSTDLSSGRSPAWGVTFSKSYAQDLQLDWRKTYQAILDDLHVNHLRLSAYWDEIEPTAGHYQFTDLDWQINQATAYKADIILAVGRRLPRWPECHDPAWLKEVSAAKGQAALDTVIQQVVTRYKDNPSIIAWQVENEPLFGWFGVCPPPDINHLRSEVALVRSLDPTRPIMITDTGELSTWLPAGGVGDVLGITLYRIVWNQQLGFWHYWFVPAAAYHWKADIIKMFHPSLGSVIVTELQMEPWTFNRPMIELTLDEQRQSFDLKQFKGNVAYARRTGFRSVYAWGVEYWYWLKLQGHDDIWAEARKLWQ